MKIKKQKDNVENTEEIKKIIVSVRCKDQEISIPGSEKRPCLRCGELVWVSPSLKNDKMDGVICTHCIREEDFEKDNRFIVKKEVIEEFEKFIIQQKMSEFKENKFKNYGM